MKAIAFQESPIARSARSRRRGAIFVTALWVTVMLVAMVLVMCRSMRVEGTAAANRLTNAQTDAIEKGAEQYVLTQVDGCNGDALTVTSAPAEGMPLGGGYFWILRPWPDTDQQWGFGITDEASKFNLNAVVNTQNGAPSPTAAVAQLAMLPNVSQQLAAAIVDWRDADSTASNNGAESDYYQGLDQFAYNAKNADFETVEELMLVRDVTKDVLFGSDYNRDGVVTPDELARASNNSLSNNIDSAYPDSRGLFNFVTVSTVEPNKASDGTARININTQSTQVRQQLQKLIPAKATTYWRNLERTHYQIAAPPGGNGRGKAAAATPSGTGASKTPAVADPGANPKFVNLGQFYKDAQMTPEDFDLVADYFTVSAEKTLKGNVNVNTAPKQVLMALGLQETDAESLVAQRNSTTTTPPTGYGWVFKALSPVEKAIAISGQITTKSYQYSADIVAVSGDGRTFKRVRVIVDGSTSPSKIVYRRDLTSYGWPLDPRIREQLRKGKYSPPVVNTEPAQGLPNNGLNSLQ